MSTSCRRGGVNDGAENSTISSFTHQLPSDLSQTDRVSVEQTTRICNTKSCSFTRTEKLHEKLAALQAKTKRMSLDLEKTKEIIDLNNLDTSKVILSDIHAMINAVVSKNDDNSNNQVDQALKPISLVNDEEIEE
ncbi:hypothetical protein TSUD_17350 [Trifolium subterraneum]|uniref:Uncharacterized protein n=1 Tax=Trifolium subterraneum TaxID=3900 RepID=A0A2Z6M547_TRISU|nr:hypothetical protein TSUD_17350 [Trifolium subterraneum]